MRVVIRILRVLRLVGVCFCWVCVAAVIVSFVFPFAYIGMTGGAGLSAGHVCIALGQFAGPYGFRALPLLQADDWWDVYQTTIHLGSRVSCKSLWLFLLGAILITGSATLVLRFWREPGRCRRCGYDLTGNVSGVCPECGVEVARNARS